MKRRHMAWAAGAAVVVLAAGAWALAGVGRGQSSGQLAQPAIPAHCVVSPVAEPDPACNPGATNPAVTPTTLASTICRSGWTSTVRPATAYTNTLKVRQLRAYGYADQNPAHYEEDHIVPLEVGGHPSSALNLWPEPRTGTYPASSKDALENYLKARVCGGAEPLAQAQHAIATDWVGTWVAAGRP